MHRGWIAALVAVGLLSAGGAAATWDDDARVILTVGDDVPGLGRLGIYGVQEPVALDDDGRVVLPGISSEGHEGLYRGGPDGLSVLWSSRAPAPFGSLTPRVLVSRGGRVWLAEFPDVYELAPGGLEPVASLTDLLPADEQTCAGDFRLALNDRGDLAFQVAVAPRATGCDDHEAPAGNESAAIYLRAAGEAAARVVARRPTRPDDQFDVLSLFALADDGGVLFTDLVADDDVARGLFAWRDGATRALVTPATMAPDGSALGAFTALAANGAGEVLLTAQGDGAAYRTTTEGVRRVLGRGDPGPAGVPIDAIVSGALNARGEVAAVVQWTGAPLSPFTSDRVGVMFVATDGVPRAVAGDATSAVLNAHGEVAYFALSGAPGTPLLLQNGPHAIEVWRDGVATRVVADGDAAPGGGRFASQWLVAHGLRQALDGRVLLNSYSSDKRQGVLCGDAAGFRAVVRQGDAAPGGGVFTQFGQLQEAGDALLFAAATGPEPHTYGGPVAIYRASAERLERVIGEGDVAELGIVVGRLGDAVSGAAGVPFYEPSRVAFSAAPDGSVLIHADSSSGRQSFRRRPDAPIEVARLGAVMHAALAGDGAVIAATRGAGDPPPRVPGPYGRIVRWDGGPAPLELLAFDDPVFGAPARLFSGIVVQGMRVFFQVGSLAREWYAYTLDDAALAVLPPLAVEPQRRCLTLTAVTPDGRLLCVIGHVDGSNGPPFPYLLADARAAQVLPPLSSPAERVVGFNDRGDVLLYAQRSAAGVSRGQLRRVGAAADAACPVPPTVPAEPFPTAPTPTPGPAPQCTGDRADCVRIVATLGSGQRGDVVPLEVRLASGGWLVAGVQSDLGFDTDAARIAAAENGRPACRVDAAIDKSATAFAFLGDGGVRAVVLALDNVDPIADGAVLYTCDVRIADTARAGSYTLHVRGTGASDANGLALPSLGEAARLVVLDAGEVPVGGAGGAAGGCQVAPPRVARLELLWLLCGALVARLCRGRGAAGRVE